MQERFKATVGQGKYGTLEELLSATPLNERGMSFEKDELEKSPYKIEVTSAGDKFQATATPKTYGKASRRSFFIDESGVLRGADHKGEPATADDPTVD